MNLIKDGRPDIVIVFGADHVYRMDPRQMIDQHASNASAALSTTAPSTPQAISDCRQRSHQAMESDESRRRRSLLGHTVTCRIY
jgi:ADP-glucose pyrophosphorylase